MNGTGEGEALPVRLSGRPKCARPTLHARSGTETSLARAAQFKMQAKQTLAHVRSRQLTAGADPQVRKIHGAVRGAHALS